MPKTIPYMHIYENANIILHNHGKVCVFLHTIWKIGEATRGGGVGWMGGTKILLREQYRDLIPKSHTIPKRQTKLRSIVIFILVSTEYTKLLHRNQPNFL